MRRLDGGERERHLRAKDLRNLRPRAVLGQPRRPLGAGPVLHFVNIYGAFYTVYGVYFGSTPVLA